MGSAHQEANTRFVKGLARAIAGAVIFALPMLMTMEMWSLGFYIPSWKLALLLVLFFPVLVVLSWHAGFEPTFSWKDDTVDALVAYAVGFATSAGILWLTGGLEAGASLQEGVGKVSLQAVPASIGALLAQSQLGEQPAGQPRGGLQHYASELFIMGIGALFLAFNLAPTEEMVLIAARVTPCQPVLVALVSLAAMHAFVYGAAFRGGPQHHGQVAAWSLFLRYSVVGYALALLLCAAMLWWFDRFNGLALGPTLRIVVVLGFPAGVGAAAARLIL